MKIIAVPEQHSALIEKNHGVTFLYSWLLWVLSSKYIKHTTYICVLIYPCSQISGWILNYQWNMINLASVLPHKMASNFNHVITFTVPRPAVNSSIKNASIIKQYTIIYKSGFVAQPNSKIKHVTRIINTIKRYCVYLMPVESILYFVIIHIGLSAACHHSHRLKVLPLT